MEERMDALEEKTAALERKILRYHLIIAFILISLVVMTISNILFQFGLTQTYEVIIDYMETVNRLLNQILQAV